MKFQLTVWTSLKFAAILQPSLLQCGLHDLQILSRVLQRALPGGHAPDAEELSGMKAKYLRERDASTVKLDPADKDAVKRASQEASSLYLWPRKAKIWEK